MIDAIKKDLNLIYDGNPWYGRSVRSVFESVNPDHIFQMPGSGKHSIANIVAHMLARREFVEHRLQGETDGTPEQELNYDWRRFSACKEHVWDVMNNRFATNQQNMMILLNRQEDSLLEQRVAGKPYTFYDLLTGLLQHDAYHLGQIAYIQESLYKESRKQRTANYLRYSFRVFPFEGLVRQK